MRSCSCRSRAPARSCSSRSRGCWCGPSAAGSSSTARAIARPVDGRRRAAAARAARRRLPRRLRDGAEPAADRRRPRRRSAGRRAPVHVRGSADPAVRRRRAGAMSGAPAHRVLVTGGAGFVGANLASRSPARHPDWELVALDNLKRRGSELNLAAAARGGRRVRPRRRARARRPRGASARSTRSSSARPSRPCWPASTARRTTSCSTNLARRLPLPRARAARRRAARLPLDEPRLSGRARSSALALRRRPTTRFELRRRAGRCRASRRAGVAEDFPLDGARTLYGATKLAAELLIAEYAETYGAARGGRPLRRDRRAVADGQGRPGRVHVLDARPPLRPRRCATSATAATGKQVRDLLHVDDLVDLVDEQLARPGPLGGRDGQRRRRARGAASRCSRRPTLCRELTGREVPVGRAGERPPGRRARSTCRTARALFAHTDWRPRRGAARRCSRTSLEWIASNEARRARGAR